MRLEFVEEREGLAVEVGLVADDHLRVTRIGRSIATKGCSRSTFTRARDPASAERAARSSSTVTGGDREAAASAQLRVTGGLVDNVRCGGVSRG
jgi:hypothetical protein